MGAAFTLGCATSVPASAPGTPAPGAGAGARAGAADASDAGRAGSFPVRLDPFSLEALATAGSSDEYALHLFARSASRTSWGESGNEAVVLEVWNGSTFVGHLILTQGADGATYSMHVGAMNAGDSLSFRVSPYTAAHAELAAEVSGVTLTAASQMGKAAEGLRNAPIVNWPAEVRFIDTPIMLGWAASDQSYQLVNTKESGGTVVYCGGGSLGYEAEFSGWGRAEDIDFVYSYGSVPTWFRCTGETRLSEHPLHFQDQHPVVYYGDGHNNLFESRGGYDQTCGTDLAASPFGALHGWDLDNPGNDPSLDPRYTLVLRPLPVDMDALGYAQSWGRREALVDHFPSLYRLTDLELRRLGKIDERHTLDMERYLFADITASSVQGFSDQVCNILHIGGFKLFANTADASFGSPQVTGPFFGDGVQTKRVAIKLDAPHAASDFQSFTFRALNLDGIYLLGQGDAFLVSPVGDNSAELHYVHRGVRPLAQYVDEDFSSCENGVNSDGPDGGSYPCVGGEFTF